MRQPYDEEFKYLGAVIGLIFGLYTLSVGIIVTALFCSSSRDYIRRTPHLDTSDSYTPMTVKGKFEKITKEYFSGLLFETSYLSFPGKHWAIFLCVFRGLAFSFFLAIPCIWNYILDGYSWEYFTFWNIDLISIYFLLATITSIIGLSKNKQSNNNLSHGGLVFESWSKFDIFLSTAHQILFETAFPAALFVTVFSYTLLHAKLDFWNITYHLMNTIALSFDFFLNSVAFRWEHVLFVLSWFLLYVMYAWGMTATYEIAYWPYNILDTSAPIALFWYALLYILGIVVFFIMYGLSKIKIFLRGASLTPLLVLEVSEDRAVVANTYY
jgi:hypothetical protein